MKTYTVKNIEKLEQICFKYENGLKANSYPEDFWSLYYCNRDGGAVEPELATYANFQVYDFDGSHDFDYLKARLIEAGLEIPGTEKEWDGWGECEWGNKTLYGYDLQLPNPVESVKLAENGTEEDGTIWAWVYITLKSGKSTSQLFKKNPGAVSWYTEQWTDANILLEYFFEDEEADAILDETYKTGLWEDL